jgi:two-component system chemotaxis response regulator CheB
VLIERDQSLALSVDEPVHYSRPSIDVLFESAADALGARVVGLLLSGSSEDGAAGLARIARAGGVALVQDPATAQHAIMPAAGVRMTPKARAIAADQVAVYLAALAGVRAEERIP